MVIKHVSPKVFIAKKMHKILEGKQCTFCFATYFPLGSIIESHYCRQQMWLALAHSWGTEIVGEIGWQVQVQKNSFSPNSPAFMFICRGNQANTTVKESLEGDAKSGNHSVWAVYSVVKVRRTTFFNLPCVVSCLNEPRDFFTSALEPALPSLRSESQSNPRPCSLL